MDLYAQAVEFLGELPPQLEFLYFIMVFVLAIGIIISFIMIIKLTINLLGGRY